MSVIPVRMLNEIQFCERLFHLMHVQGLFEDNADTIEGTAQHEKSRQRMRKRHAAPEEVWKDAPLSLHLGDEELGITGKLDAVKLEGGLWIPVESKHSASPEKEGGFEVEGRTLKGNAWPNDQIQLCAQGLLLRANGYACEYGELFYRGNRKRVRVEFGSELIAATRSLIERAREISKSPMPKPLVDSKKCFRCSLNYICLPDETNYLLGVSTPIRRIVPSRVDGGVLYVSEPGTKLGVSGEGLVITK